MAELNLDDYITVAERLTAFYERYPQGSITAEILEDDGKRVVMIARAYRMPTDPHPGTGHAEEIRGATLVNKTSAIENCETSAWGRAIAALGFHVSKGVASREEVEQAIAEEQRQNNTVGEDWVADARKRIKAASIPSADVKMKLTSFNAALLSDLSPKDAAEFDAWLTELAELVKANG